MHDLSIVGSSLKKQHSIRSLIKLDITWTFSTMLVAMAIGKRYQSSHGRWASMHQIENVRVHAGFRSEARFNTRVVVLSNCLLLAHQVLFIRHKLNASWLSNPPGMR